MIKLKRMRWAWHVAHIEKRGMHIGFLWESQKGRDHEEDVDIDGKMILKWIFERGDIDSIDLGQGRDQWRALVYTVMNIRVP
jgi:hypothetical protein